MSFKFNFSAGNESDSDNDDTSTPSNSKPVPAQTPPQYHSLQSLITTLPQNISYTTLAITKSIRIPRRELYDVRMQLMAEDKLGEDEQKSALVGLGDEDIRTSFYEGGLKSWECSVDLVKYLASGEGLGVASRVLELGCGTSLPSLYLLRTTLDVAKGPYHFTFADYNIEVLRLVTLPNLFLSWSMRSSTNWDAEGDLEVNDTLILEFMADLNRAGVTIDFVSGGWGLGMLELLQTPYDLVMGSETIYSPATTELFTDVLLGSLKESGRGLVAAKQIYFGVGGSVTDFVGGVDKRGGWGTRVVREERDVGVGRSIIEVRNSPE